MNMSWCFYAVRCWKRGNDGVLYGPLIMRRYTCTCDTKSINEKRENKEAKYNYIYMLVSMYLV